MEPAYSKAYLSGVPKESRLDTYYDAVLAQIPKGAWIIKIDADEILDPDLLKESFKMIKHESDVVSYPRINIHVGNGGVFVLCSSNNMGIITPRDHLLINKDGLSHTMYTSKEPFTAWEVTQFSDRSVHNAKLMTYHFMFLKNWRSKEEIEKVFGNIYFVPLDKVKKMLPVEGIEIPPGFLDKKRILKIYNSFDLEHLKCKK